MFLFGINSSRATMMLTAVLAALSVLAARVSATQPYAGTYGYHTVPGKGIYKVHRERVSWKEAWRSCSEEDAHLAILETREEAETIRLMLRANQMRARGTEPLVSDNTFFVSIGFHSLYSDRFWTTVFGDPVDQFYNAWARGRPSSFGSVSQCGAVNLNLELVDIPCEGKEFPFVCERVLS